MDFKEYAQFKELWRAACENTLGKIPTETALSLAFGVLSPYQLSDVRAALIKCLKDSEFKPTPATVKDMLDGGRPEDRARVAYGKVLKALRKIRSGESVRFGDPCIHWALENGCNGWTGFARMEQKDGERLFTEFYVTAARNGADWNSDGVPDHLAGDREQRGSVLNPWDVSQIVNVNDLEAPQLKRLT